mgnify:CR=1 FL=1
MIGECMVELSPSTEAKMFSQGFAGDVFNSGIYLKRCLKIQANVSFLSVIGDDALSEQLVELMKEEQLDTSMLYRSTTEKLGLYLIHIDEEGERSFTYWRENSAAKQLMKHVIGNSNSKAFDDVNIVFISGISLAILPSIDLPAFWQFLAKLKQTGCKIVFDPNYRPALWLSSEHAKEAFDKAYSLSDIVLPGVDDHIELYDQKSAEEVASYLESLGVEEIIIKNGEHGVLSSVNGERRQIDITPVENVVDTTSAGDAFNGGYLSARYDGKSVTDSILFAAEVAACVIQYKGAIVAKENFLAATK